MNEKIKFQRKYNKCINILLAIYVTLCLVLSLLFNSFFIKTKAFSDGFSYSISETATENGNIIGQKTTTVTSQGRTKAIFCTDPELKEIIDNLVASEYGEGMVGTLIRVRTPEQGLGGTLSSTSTGGGVNAQKYYFVNETHPTLYAYFQKYNINLNFEDRSGVVELYLNGVNASFPDQIISTKLLDDVEFVNNGDDLRKYINDNDDSVVNIGNPDNPQLPEDDSLPVPQALTCDLKNNDESAPRFISGSWTNPSSLLASYDAEKINIEIQYKPKLQFYKRLFDLKLGVGTTSMWLPVTKMKLSEISNWTSYMNLSDNNPDSDGKSFHKNGKEDIQNIALQNDFNSYSSHVELLNGTTWRCRYEVNGNTSLWVVYGVDSINQFGRPSNSGDNISFENASGDSVSAEDVEYNNSNMTDKDYDNLSLLGKIRYDLDNLFTSLKSFFNPVDNDNGFYAFFGKVFEQFPIFWTLFILGLVVAILLRIFGR